MESGITAELIRHIKESYGKVVHKVMPIDHGVVNENFVCHADDEKFICKIYTQKTAAEIAFELEVLNKLANSDFPCPRVEKNKEGGQVTYFNDKPLILYRYIHGETLGAATLDQAKAMGEKLGELHSLLQDFKPTVMRPTWDPEDLSKLVKERGDELALRGFPEAENLLDFMSSELQKFSFPKDLPTGITHQDLKPENVIVDGGCISGIVDFDNCYRGVLLFDLMTTVIWTCFRDGRLDHKLYESVISGYEMKRPLLSSEKDNMQDALKWRLLREVFIGPFAAAKGKEKVTAERSRYFKELFARMGQ